MIPKGATIASSHVQWKGRSLIVFISYHMFNHVCYMFILSKLLFIQCKAL